MNDDKLEAPPIEVWIAHTPDTMPKTVHIVKHASEQAARAFGTKPHRYILASVAAELARECLNTLLTFDGTVRGRTEDATRAARAKVQELERRIAELESEP